MTLDKLIVLVLLNHLAETIDLGAHLYLKLIDIDVALNTGAGLEGQSVPDVCVTFHLSPEIKHITEYRALDFRSLTDDYASCGLDLSFNLAIYAYISRTDDVTFDEYSGGNMADIIYVNEWFSDFSHIIILMVF